MDSELYQWALQGEAQAQFVVGCFFEGCEDYAEAVKWYRRAAEQGYVDAQNNLGECYESGQGVEQNYDKAVKWYRKAAEQGDVNAQNNLGECYKEGKGVGLDYEEAVRWYRKAAEQGDEDAQYELGNFYFSGDGVPKDYEEAAHWYMEAAEQRHKPSQEMLNILYKFYGVKQYGTSSQESHIQKEVQQPQTTPQQQSTQPRQQRVQPQSESQERQGVSQQHKSLSGDKSCVLRILWIVVFLLIAMVVFLWLRGNGVQPFPARDEEVTADTLADNSSTTSMNEEVFEVEYDTACIVEDANEAVEDIDGIGVVDAYIGKIKEMKQWCTENELYNDIWCEYFLFDITQNGVPDLWLTYGTCEANKEFRVYTYKRREMQKLYQGSYGHSAFYAGSDYVIQMGAHMGDAWWYKYTYDNEKMNGVLVYEETTDDEYTYPKEKHIELTSWDDTAPIERMTVC